MMETKTIRELCDIVVDCPHSTPKWTTSGKIVIRNNNIKKGRIDFSSPSYTDDEHFNLRVKRAIPNRHCRRNIRWSKSNRKLR